MEIIKADCNYRFLNHLLLHYYTGKRLPAESKTLQPVTYFGILFALTSV